MFIMKYGNVPYDVAFGCSNTTRFAMYVKVASFEGSDFNWATRSFVQRN